jgi:hypothetical protein
MKVNFTIGIPAWLDRLFAWPVMWYRKRKYGYSFRRIYLGEGKWAILDAKDYYHLKRFKWVVYGTGSNLYAVRLKMTGPNKTNILSMHRAIMNAPANLLVDHRNTDSLDNRRQNLRFATKSQNAFNRRKRKDTTSQYRGVFFSTADMKVKSHIRAKE